jgi:hypothetical protein
MPIKSYIIGNGDSKHCDTHEKENDTGLVVYTRDRKTRTLGTAAAFNQTLGINMAVDASFGGTPEGVHNGGDNTYWTATALTGTWDFVSTTNPAAGSACIEKTTTFNGDEALFTDSGGGSINMANYVGITGQIRLERFKVNDEVTVQFRLGGVLVGNSVNILDFINTGTLNTYQSFSLSKDAMGTNSEIDEIIITTVNKPEFRLDTLQIEETGGTATFTILPPEKDMLFYITKFELSIVDAYAGTLVDATMPNLSYDKILSQNALTNGINIQVITNGTVDFSFSTRTIGDALKGGGRLRNMISDGTNTCITLVSENEVPIRLDPRHNDRIEYSVSENLTGLISITAINFGWVEEFE